MKKNHSDFNPWSFCERCWFLYPLGMLVAQKGLRVCTLYCFDNTDIEYRPYIIQSVLGDDSQEGMPITPEVQQNPEEILF